MCGISNKMPVYSVFAVRPPLKHTHHVAREAGKRTGRGCTARSSTIRSALHIFYHKYKLVLVLFYFIFFTKVCVLCAV